jgi:predicted DNA-binding protein (MmcQ/YjbR family)
MLYFEKYRKPVNAMDIETYRDYCLSKPFVTEAFPFDSETLVFKVSGKIFALCDINNFKSVNLKCDPEKAIELREQFDAVIPGFHMNKKHWNTIMFDGSISWKQLKEWIDDSYGLVAKQK